MSLDLDRRRRAMLQEMHVRVWQPLPAAAFGSTAGPLAGAANAIEIIATDADMVRANSQNHSQSQRIEASAPTATPVVAPGADRHAATGQHGAPVGQRRPEPVADANRADRPDTSLAQVAVGAAVVVPPPIPGLRSVAALDWLALQQAVAGCTACGLCQRRLHTVFGVGPQSVDSAAVATAAPPPTLDWLVLGEAPGEHEDRQGLPFVGPAGQLLDKMLAAIGLSRHGAGGTEAVSASGPATPKAALQGVYITNVIKCRPPGNRNPTPDELAHCLPYLQRQIELLQPKMILALGRFAAQTLLAESLPHERDWVLGRLRGRLHQYRGIPLVVSYHPSYLLRSPGEKGKSWADLCLALAHWRSLAQAGNALP